MGSKSGARSSLDSSVFVGRVSRDGTLPKSEYNDVFWEGEGLP